MGLKKARAVIKAWTPARTIIGRKFTRGDCDDCGLERLVTVVTFSVSGQQFRVCARCIKRYLDQIDGVS